MSAPQSINRRVFIASGAAGVATLAAAEIGADANAQMEHPWDRARRLADELAEVLAMDIGDGAGPGGKWFAEIYPTIDREYAVGFGNIKSREWPNHNVSLPCQKVIDDHKAARVEFEKACRETDCDNPSKTAQRRYNRRNRAEEDALAAVCSYLPHGRADAKAKSAYLVKFARLGELTEAHIEALIYAGVRA